MILCLGRFTDITMVPAGKMGVGDIQAIRSFGM